MKHINYNNPPLSTAMVYKLRKLYGCIIWISPISDGDTLEVLGWYYEGEWLLSKNMDEHTFYNATMHDTPEEAEKSATLWACDKLVITLYDLIGK